jgi:hypothetical protein
VAPAPAARGGGGEGAAPPPSRRRGGGRCQRRHLLVKIHVVETATAMQHGPNQSVPKSSDGRRVRARGHDDSRGRRRPEINQSRRAAMAGESGREGMTIAEDSAKAKKADEEEAANFFFRKGAPCGRK